MTSTQNEDDGRSGSAHTPELLTPDEQLIRHERWSETRDLPTAIRALAKLHHLDEDSGAIDESEAWSEFVTELATMITELITQLSKPSNTKG